MLLQPPSWHPDVWTDIARMRTLNTMQAQKGKEQHLCPLPFDIVERLIRRYSNEGDLVLDPFAGIGTVPLEARKLGRRGRHRAQPRLLPRQRPLPRGRDAPAGDADAVRPRRDPQILDP
jgi:hypothetical protein